MQEDENSSDSSDTEVEEEEENNEWWDNFQEDPSYLEVSVNSAQESQEAERYNSWYGRLSLIQIQTVPIQSGHQEGHLLSQNFSQNISYLETC